MHARERESERVRKESNKFFTGTELMDDVISSRWKNQLVIMSRDSIESEMQREQQKL